MALRLPINGIRHHAFKGRLEELYRLAPGKRVTLSVEHENEVERDAVICFLGQEHLGYVRTGHDHDVALQMVESSGRRSVLGRIVELDKVGRIIWVEVEAHAVIDCPKACTGNLLESWHYEGPLLPEEREVTLLHSMMDTLEMLVEAGTPWDLEMQQYLESIEEHGWRDMSMEFRLQLEHTLKLMTESESMEGYGKAANQLQYFIDHMGSPETRKQQANWLLGMVHSTEMKRIRTAFGEQVEEVVRLLPENFINLFLTDGELLMGRLWYLRQGYTNIRGLMTLLALGVFMKEENQEIVPHQIPRDWIVAWAQRRNNEAKADTVRQLICDYELERSNKPLTNQLDAMEEACRQKGQTFNYNAPVGVQVAQTSMVVCPQKN